MKRVVMLVFLFVAAAFAQSNPGLDLLAEAERITPLRGSPTIQVALLTERGGLVAGTFKYAELLARLEQYLRDNNIPFNSAKQGVALKNDTLWVTIELLPVGSSRLAYYITLKLTQVATALRHPESPKHLSVWDTHRFGVALNGEDVLSSVMDLMARFATDYLRANPELQPRFGR